LTDRVDLLIARQGQVVFLRSSSQ